MAVSRRFETRFAYNLFAIQNGTLKLQTVNLIVSNQNASNSSYPYLGIPPLNYYAFLSQNVMDANNGRWWLIASNTGSGNPYPNTIKSYSDSVWGRLPHQISWRTSRPGIPSSNFGTYNKSGIYTPSCSSWV